MTSAVFQAPGSHHVPAETRHTDLPSVDRPKILIVESDDAVARAFAEEGREAGYAIVVTDNGIDAVNLAVSEDPQAILFDIDIPGLEGRDVMARLNNLGITKRSVVVLVSSRDQQHDRRWGLELGAQRYEIKPVRAAMLFTKIGRLLEKAACRRDLMRPPLN